MTIIMLFKGYNKHTVVPPFLNITFLNREAIIHRKAKELELPEIYETKGKAVIPNKYIFYV